MQPQTAAQPGRADGFKPKYRHFHPNDRVWVKNPFGHDVVYQVADEYNRPFRYRLPAGKISELPGGAIATLGVKAIVDELIQNDPNNSSEGALLMWDERVRGKHEADIIVKVSNLTPKADAANPGEINLATSSDEVPQEEPEEPAAPEEAFPGLNQPQPEPAAPVSAAPALPPQTEAGLADVVAASLPRNDAVVGANNAHPDAEG